MKKLLALGIAALVAGAAYWYTHTAGEAPQPGDVAKGGASPLKAGGGMPVEAAVIKPRRLAQEIIAVGSLISDESVILSSEISGRIASISFTEGQPVAAGDLLFKLDDSVYAAELEQARAGLKLSQSDHDRAQGLFTRQLISVRERDAAAAKLDVDRATVALAEARLAKTRIRAPFRGVAGLRQVSPGEYINPGQPLAPLESMSVLKMDFRLSEAALSAIKVGQILNLEVDSYPGEVFPGTVYAIDPRLAEATRSVGVRARVPNPERRLRPGLFARVRLTISENAAALLVPEQAIVPQGDSSFVYVIEAGTAVMRKVEIGQRKGGLAEITSGLKDGDTVITAGMQKIGPGAPVMAINLAPPPPVAPAPAATDGKS